MPTSAYHNSCRWVGEGAARQSACLPHCLPACCTVCLPAPLSVCLLHCLPACRTVCLPAALSACLPHCLPACRIVCTLYLSACVLPVCTRGVCLCSHHMASVNVFILSLPIARSLLQPSRARARDPRHAPPTLTCTHARTHVTHAMLSRCYCPACTHTRAHTHTHAHTHTCTHTHVHT